MNAYGIRCENGCNKTNTEMVWYQSKTVKTLGYSPKHVYANNGIISQIAMEKTGERIWYNGFDEIKAELNKILGL